jgi:hypothetical protein
MTLTTHAVVGAAVAKIIGVNPAFGFLGGMASHYVLDSIIHWDYRLKSKCMDFEKPAEEFPVKRIFYDINFFIDLLKVGIDLALGFVLVFLFFPRPDSYMNYILLSGAVGGVLPDLLQFVYFKFKKEPFITFQKIHTWAHSQKKLDNFPVLGFSLQAFIILIVIVISKFFQ